MLIKEETMERTVTALLSECHFSKIITRESSHLVNIEEIEKLVKIIELIFFKSKIYCVLKIFLNIMIYYCKVKMLDTL